MLKALAVSLVCRERYDKKRGATPACGAPRAIPWHGQVRPWGGILSKRPRPRPGLESKGQ